MTNAMEPGRCRDVLARLLGEEISQLAELATQLDREHGFLVANDVDGLEGAGAERQGTVARLLRIEDERRSLCSIMGVPADLAGVERLIRWCDPDATLLPAFRDCLDRATRCRQGNDRNGALVTARLQRVTRLLGALDSNAASGRVYGPRSTAPATSTQPGRMLATSA
jgi:flagellar biosynthesis protein FlgN